MKKQTIETIVDNTSDVIKNIGGWFKKNFDDNGQDLVDNASGTVGLLIKFFGKSAVDKYFEHQTKNKLNDFGLATYTKTALTQAVNTLEKLNPDIENLNITADTIKLYKEVVDTSFCNVDKTNLLPLFSPVYHPVVMKVKTSYATLLKVSGASNTIIDRFYNDFNTNIEDQIEKQFGNDYDEHLEQINAHLLQKNEERFLTAMHNLSKVGLTEKENLKYEETFGSWTPVCNILKGDNEDRYKGDPTEIEEIEKELKPVRDLVDEYFGDTESIEKILFIVADFGKGKSVFMKQYASELAMKYARTHEGYFPIYFNLRDYGNFEPNGSLGIVDDYMQTRYGIDVANEYYKSKKYMFLIDSLDESGELSEHKIEQVVNSVKKLQGIDKVKARNNRLIIASRPMDRGLTSQIEKNEPYRIKSENDRSIDYCISLYGFKKEQFNDWLCNSINKYTDLPTQPNDFVGNLLKQIKEQGSADIYASLLYKGTLSRSELRRPIFAYMVYQLIINNIDFVSLGKIGIYLSFINLLTKKAKHIKDPHYKVDLQEEFEFRNVLHAIAALWQHNRFSGQQGSLDRKDIYKVIDFRPGETDENLLKRNQESGLTEIEFLSHSYFGKSSDTLHFQHQSFAEILLAEYYLKIFICYALSKEKKSHLDEVRAKLHLGTPTDQTIQFFKELLQLLKDSVTEDTNHETIEKRRLLFPLFASIAKEKHNTLFCNQIYYKWYEIYCENMDTSDVEYPNGSLQNWCINQEQLERIIQLAADIINDKNEYRISKSTRLSSLYDKEIIVLHDFNTKEDINIDKWLSIFVGNILYSDLSAKSQIDAEKPKLFNWDYKIDGRILFDLIESRVWLKTAFMGIDLSNNEESIYLKINSLSRIYFSYSFLNNIFFDNIAFYDVHFNYCTLSNISFFNLSLYDFNFENIIIKSNVFFDQVSISNIQLNIFLFSGIINPENEDEFIFIDPMYIPLADMSVFFERFIHFMKSILPYREVLEFDEFEILEDRVKFYPEGLNDYYKEAFELEDEEKIIDYFKSKQVEIFQKVYGIKNIDKNKEYRIEYIDRVF